MSFEWPGLLWALLLVPAALAAYLAAQRRRTRYAVRFTNLDLLANVVTRTPGWRRHLPALLYLLALATLLFSLARPHTQVLVPKEQATVVLIMDVSKSMDATDVRPTRLAAAKEASLAFVDQLPERFRIGVVTFSTTAQLVTRPTTDRTAVQETLQSLHAEGGTAMGDAIERALEVRLTGGASGPAPSPPAPPGPSSTPAPGTAPRQPPLLLLLLSDGFSTEGRIQPLDAASNARALGVPVYTVALGTPLGTVELEDGMGRFRRIQVPPDEQTLRQVAEITGGRYFSAPSRGDLKSIYRDIGSRVGFERERQEVTVVLAAAALLFLVAGGALSLTWFSRFP